MNKTTCLKHFAFLRFPRIYLTFLTIFFCATMTSAQSCVAEIVCPVPENTAVDNDFGLCSAIVDFGVATINTDCPGVTDANVQFMLSQDATDPADNSVVAANTFINGQPTGLQFAVGLTTVTFRIDPAVLPVDADVDPATCGFDILVSDTELPSLICSDITVFLDEDGEASVTSEMLAGMVTVSTTGGDDQSGDFGETFYTANITESVTLDIDWVFNTNDDPEFEFFGYHLNGNFVQLTNEVDFVQSGSFSIMLSPGDIFGPQMNTEDNEFGTATGSFMGIPVTGQFSEPNWSLTNIDADGTAFFMSIGSMDNCGISSIDLDIMDFTCDDIGDNTVTVTATDEAGNQSSCLASVTVIDNLPPAVTSFPQSTTVACDGNGNLVDLALWLLTFGGAEFDDNCDENLTLSFDLITEADGCSSTGGGAYIFKAEDASGNFVEVPALFVIEDDTPPIITTEAEDIEVVCDGSNNAAELLDWLNNNGNAEATEECSTVTWTNDYGQVDAGACDGTGSITVTFTASDDCGNESTTTGILTITDDVAPIWTIDPQNVTFECTADVDPLMQIETWLGAVGFGNADDDCSVVAYSNDFTGLTPTCGTGNAGTAIVTFTAADACGNTETREATVNVVDNTKPSITVPPVDFVVECDTPENLINELFNWVLDLGGASFEDECSDIVDIVPLDFEAIPELCALGQISVTFAVVDACGNVSDPVTANFIVEDTTSPVINTMASDTTALCDGAGNTADLDSWLANNGGARATDVCGDVTWSFDLIQVNTLCELTGSGLYRFTATDVCGNESSTEASFTINDTEAPVIEDEAVDITVVCDGSNNITELLDWLNSNGEATATDNCNSIVWSNDYGQVDPGACTGSGSITVTFTATDGCGLESMTTATLTIVDNVAPIWTIDPQNVTFECNDSIDPLMQIETWLGAAGFGNADDECSVVVYTNDFIALTPTCGTGNAGTALVTFTATDACGNSDIREATVNVVDMTKPSLTNPAIDMIVECDGTGNPLELLAWLGDQGGASWDDMCSEVTENAPVLISTIEGCGSTSEMIYAFTATDACDNTSDTIVASFIIEDTTSPMITTMAVDSTALCDGIGNTADLDSWLANNGGAEATDICGDVTWIFDLVQESDLCDLTGTGTYRFTATDDCGNTATTEAAFIIVDTEAPVIVTDAVDITVVCDGDNNITELLDWLNSNGEAEATDNCNTIVWSNDYGQVDPGACTGSGSITVTFTATDACGNMSSTTATLTITDEVAPIWTIDPQNVTFECNDSIDPLMQIETWLGAVGFGDASDDCSLVVYTNDFTVLTPTCGTGNAGTALVTFTATDACGNATIREATVNVVDMTVPSVTNPATDMTVECDGAGNIAELNAWLEDFAGASWSDLCSDIEENTPVLLTTIEGCGLTNEMRYAFTAMDACGNVSDTTIGIFIIEDTTPPVIDPEAMDMTVECDGLGNDEELDAWLENMAFAGATDVCSDEPLIVEFDLVTEEDSCGITGIQVYRFTFTDNCGNSSTTEGTFTIEDTTPPVIMGGMDFFGECDQSNANNDDELLSWLNTNGGATAEDMCGTFVWTNNYDVANFVDGCNDSRNIDVTFTATDECGNFSEITLNFSTGDNTPPVFTNCPRPPVVVDAPEGWCSAFVNFSLPLAIDNCGVPIVTQTDDTGLTTGDLFPVGLTLLEFTATDSCGNETICELKIVVNDFHTPPTITCPEDVETVNDPGLCGAVVNDIPAVADDNCPDNLAIVFEVKNEFGVTIEEGIEDASGTEFPGGTSTVTYTVFDQPIILITEVLQDGPTSGIEIGNLGPASMDISCGTLTRIANGDTVMFNIPNFTMLPVGEVFIYEFPNNIAAGDQATYQLSFLDRVIDEITINDGQLDGDNIFRIDPVDNDDASDWMIANDCKLGSFGAYNPELPVFTDNGSTSSFQSTAPSIVQCSFTVTVLDVEAPTCVTQDTMAFTNTGILIEDGMCIVSTHDVVLGGPVGDVKIQDFLATIDNVGAITALLESPEGTEIMLFSGLCDNTSDIDVSLEDQAASNIQAASCSPLGNGNTYMPVEAFKAFYGEEAAGTWTLSIFADSPVMGTLDTWTLEVLVNEPYAQMDTILSNDTLVCEAEFTWVHPVFADNCCEGSMTVQFDFSNDVTGVTNTEEETILSPSGFIDLDGTEVTKIFEVGVTVITYTLTDLAGNISTCGFTVTVNDDEPPRFPNGCPDVFIFLEPGDCEGMLPFAQRPDVADNCGIDSIAYFLNGELLDIDFIPIGVNEVTLVATDIYGNMDSCIFIIDVVEFIPDTDVMSCNNAINLSLDVNCMAVLNADMILEGGPYRCFDNYCIEVTTAAGIEVDAIFDINDLNQTFTVSIIDCLGGGNSCWGTVTIEEKLTPEIECPADIELSCNQDPNGRYEDGHPLAGQLIAGEVKLLSCELNTSISYLDDIIDGGECGEPRVQILRRWKVTDNSGNSVTCDQMITILPYDPADVVFPDDFILQDAFSCALVDANPEIIQPDSTGRPTLSEQSIFGNSYCDINISFWDEIFLDANCESGYEIHRHWGISNECMPIQDGVNPLKHIQRIKVGDISAPTLYGLDDVTVSTNAWDCFGTYTLPEVVHEDDCSSYTVKWSASYGQEEDGVLYNLLPGETEVTARVKDACGNVASRSFTITTLDLTPPTVSALQNIVIGLTSGATSEEGFAKLYAESVNNGSHDNCGDVHIEIRRDEDICGVRGNSTFNADGHPEDGSPNSNSPSYDPDDGAYVKVCCEDLTNATVDVNGDGELDAGYIKVWLRVWDDGDKNGIFGSSGDNFNEAWVYVKVEDKLAPAIQCPPDVTLTCDMDYTDLNMTGSASAFGSCGEVGVEYNDIIINLNTCNEGFVRRRWSVVGSSAIFCDQTITLNDLDEPVNVSFSQVGDFTAANCPDMIALGEPTWIAGSCDVLGYSLVTDTFKFEDGACYKLVNHWTVINWCDYEPNNPFWNGSGIWEHTQVIKVTDETQPVIEDCEDKMFAINDHGDSDNDGEVCEAMITLTNVATDPGSDNCPTGWLKWQVFVDLWGDGTDDLEYSSFLPPFDTQFNDTNGNGIPDVYVSPTANGETVSIALPDIVGSMSNHKVSWKVTDGCNNVTTCDYEFMVVDKKAPTPYCIDLSTAVMESSGIVELWAIDFNIGSFDNCTDQDALRYTFSDVAPEDDSNYDPAQRSSNMVFDCGDVGNSPLEISMYVWDEKGNADFCVVYLTLVDNLGACGDGMKVAGKIETAQGEGLLEVSTQLNSLLPEFPRTDMTDEEGAFSFIGIPGNADYQITANKDVDYLNGVSTLDLVIIQRHILGLESLNSPYKLIAADINGDNTIKASDLSNLRKLILGVITDLPTNESWRFVDANQSMTMDMDLENVDYVLHLTNLQSNSIENDFVAVKVGDVTENAVANLISNTVEVRSSKTLGLMIENKMVEAGELINVEFTSENFADVYGYQFTMELKGLEFEEIREGAISVTDANVGVLENDVLTMSYHAVQPTSTNSAETIFTMKFRAKEAGQLSEMIAVSSKITESEAYVLNSSNTDIPTLLGDRLEIRKVEISSRGEKPEISTNELFQNEPNPFKNRSLIGYELAESGEVEFTITDVVGRVVLNIETKGVKGYNKLSIDARDLEGDGVYYYTMKNGAFNVTRKMILVR